MIIRTSTCQRGTVSYRQVLDITVEQEKNVIAQLQQLQQEFGYASYRLIIPYEDGQPYLLLTMWKSKRFVKPIPMKRLLNGWSDKSLHDIESGLQAMHPKEFVIYGSDIFWPRIGAHGRKLIDWIKN